MSMLFESAGKKMIKVLDGDSQYFYDAMLGRELPNKVHFCSTSGREWHARFLGSGHMQYH